MTTFTRTLAVHIDPGHGWLKVPRDLLRQLGIERKVSHCSYQRGDYVYLEEDCDAPLFIEAFKAARPGIELKFRTRYAEQRSRIRSYDGYSAGPWAPECGHFWLARRIYLTQVTGYEINRFRRGLAYGVLSGRINQSINGHWVFTEDLIPYPHKSGEF